MSKTKRRLPMKKLVPLFFVLGVAVVGAAILIASHAATPTAAIEPETGTLTGNSTKITDTNASGGAAVRFDAPASGGISTCNNPIGSASDASGTIVIGTSGLFQVRNEAWNGSHGPQTIFACSEQSWYVTSNQTNIQGQVETYPDSLYSISGSKTISQYTSITSTFGETYQPVGDWDAAYDLWMNNWKKEVMIWNEWNGSPAYWPSVAKTAVSLNGVPYHFYAHGAELMFFRDTQVKSGSVDILAAYKWLITQGLLVSSDVPTQIEYGIEICATVGTQRFDTTAFTVSLN